MLDKSRTQSNRADSFILSITSPVLKVYKKANSCLNLCGYLCKYPVYWTKSWQLGNRVEYLELYQSTNIIIYKMMKENSQGD